MRRHLRDLTLYALTIASLLIAPHSIHAAPPSQAHRTVTLRVPPVYPELAKRMGISGAVTILAIVLPDGTSTVGGHIETVGTVATCPGGSGIGAGGGASGSAGQSPCESSGSGTSSAATATTRPPTRRASSPSPAACEAWRSTRRSRTPSR